MTEDADLLTLDTLASKAMGQRIGLLGGSFNPAHNGHLRNSLYALDALGLDGVWWLVNPLNPLKKEADMAPLAQRVKQACQLCASHPQITVTCLEKELHTQYTVDTLDKMTTFFPLTRFVWLMGADNLEQIDQWRDWKRLFRTVPIAVFRRPGYTRSGVSSPAGAFFASSYKERAAYKALAVMTPPAWTILDNPDIALSATDLRAAQTFHSTGE